MINYYCPNCGEKAIKVKVLGEEMLHCPSCIICFRKNMAKVKIRLNLAKLREDIRKSYKVSLWTKFKIGLAISLGLIITIILLLLFLLFLFVLIFNPISLGIMCIFMIFVILAGMKK